MTNTKQKRKIAFTCFANVTTPFGSRKSLFISDSPTQTEMRELHAIIASEPAESLFSSGIFLDNTRNNENFRSSSLVTLDIDDGKMTIQEAKKKLKGYAHIVYTTRSHDILKHSFRIIVVLSKPVSGDMAFSAAVKEFSEKLGIPTDPKTLDAAHIFWVPGKNSLFACEGGKAFVPSKFKPSPEQKAAIEAKKASITLRSPLSKQKFTFESKQQSPFGEHSVYRQTMKKNIFRINLSVVPKKGNIRYREAGYLIATFEGKNAPAAFHCPSKGIFRLSDGRFLVAFKDRKAEDLRTALLDAGATIVEAHFAASDRSGIDFVGSKLFSEVVDIIRFNDEVTDPSQIVCSKKATEIGVATGKALAAYRKGEMKKLKIELKIDGAKDAVNTILRKAYAPSKDGYRALFAKIAVLAARGRSGKKALCRSWLALQCDTSIDIVARVLRVLESQGIIKRVEECIPGVKSTIYDVMELKKVLGVEENVEEAAPQDGHFNDWIYNFVLRRKSFMKAQAILDDLMSKYRDFVEAKADRLPLAEYLCGRHAA